MLKDSDRLKLDGVIRKAKALGYSKDKLREVVSDFTLKYDVPEQEDKSFVDKVKSGIVGAKDYALDKAYTVDKAIGDYAFRNIPSKIQAATDPRRAKVKEEISLQEQGLPQTSVRKPDESSFFGLLNTTGAKAPSREDFPTTGYEGATFGELQAELAKIKSESLSDEEYYKAKNPALYHGSGIASGMALDTLLGGGIASAVKTVPTIGLRESTKLPKVLEGLANKFPKIREMYPKILEEAVNVSKGLKRPLTSSVELGAESAIRGDKSIEEGLKYGFLGDILIGSGGRISDKLFRKAAPMLTGIKKEFVDLSLSVRNFKDRVPFIDKAVKLFKHINNVGKEATKISGNIQKKLHEAPSVSYKKLIKELDEAKKKYTDFKGGSKEIDKFVQEFYDDIGYNSVKGKVNLNHMKTSLQKMNDKLYSIKRKGDYVDMPSKIKKEFGAIINENYLSSVDGYIEAMEKAKANMDIFNEFQKHFESPQELYQAIKKKNKMITSGNLQMEDTKIQALEAFDNKIFNGDIRRSIDKDIAQESIYAPNKTWAEDIRESGYTSILAAMAADALGFAGKPVATGILATGVARKRLGKKGYRAWLTLREKMLNEPNSIPQGARDFIGEFKNGVWKSLPKSQAKHMYLFNNNVNYRNLFEGDDDNKIDFGVERSVSNE